MKPAYLFLLSSAISCSALLSAAQRPNVLWITAEDMSPALGCYGNEYAFTPNLDALAKESVRYLNAFATAPVCSPARSCLITGIHAESLGTQHLRSDFPIPAFVHGFPHYLRQAGYYTSNNVKTDYNTASEARLVNESWNESNSNAHWRKRKDEEKKLPFFAVFNLMVSHQSRSMVYPYERFQKEVQAQLPPSQRHDPAKAPIPPYYANTPAIRRAVARFHDCVTVMDKQAGDLLRQLKDDGLAEDTLVFFFSDHGSGLPRHKRACLDSGLHVPLLVRFPKKYAHLAPGKPGSTTDRLVSFVDFPPTLLSLLGLPVPDYMQGKPFLGPKTTNPRRYVHAARDRVDEAYDFARATRDKQWLYVRTLRPDLGFNQPTYYSDLGEVRHEFHRLAQKPDVLTPAQRAYIAPTRPIEALYDCQADPHNLHNLALAPKYAKQLQRLRAEQLRHTRQVRDLAYLPEEIVRKMSDDSTPYEAARKLPSFPSDDLLDAAELIGIDEEERDTLLNLLGQNDPAVRHFGLLALGEHDYVCESCFPDLRYVMEEDDCGTNRILAAALLLENGQEDALPLLLKELRGDDPDLVLRAARSLELLGSAAKPAVPTMRKVLDAWRPKRKQGPLGLFIEFSIESALRRLNAPFGHPTLSY